MSGGVCTMCDGTKVVSCGGHDSGCDACYVAPVTTPCATAEGAGKWLYETVFPQSGGWSRCSPENQATWIAHAAHVAAITTPPARTYAEGDTETQWEVWEDDLMVASSTDEADAQHYLAVYSQDGPVRLVKAVTMRTPCDSDGSGEAGETGTGSTNGNSVGPQGIAPEPASHLTEQGVTAS